MEKKVTVLDMFAGMIVVAALFLVGVFFTLLGVTLLPVIGVVAGIAIMGLSLRLFCHIRSATERKVVIAAQTDTLCAWPPISTGNQIAVPAE